MYAAGVIAKILITWTVRKKEEDRSDEIEEGLHHLVSPVLKKQPRERDLDKWQQAINDQERELAAEHGLD